MPRTPVPAGTSERRQRVGGHIAMVVTSNEGETAPTVMDVIENRQYRPGDLLQMIAFRHAIQKTPIRAS